MPLATSTQILVHCIRRLPSVTMTPSEMNTVDVEKKPEMAPTDTSYEPSIVPIESAMEVQRVRLGWRTWVVVFISAYLA